MFSNHIKTIRLRCNDIVNSLRFLETEFRQYFGSSVVIIFITLQSIDVCQNREPRMKKQTSINVYTRYC